MVRKQSGEKGSGEKAPATAIAAPEADKVEKDVQKDVQEDVQKEEVVDVSDALGSSSCRLSLVGDLEDCTWLQPRLSLARVTWGGVEVTPSPGGAGVVSSARPAAAAGGVINDDTVSAAASDAAGVEVGQLPSSSPSSSRSAGSFEALCAEMHALARSGTESSHGHHHHQSLLMAPTPDGSRSGSDAGAETVDAPATAAAAAEAEAVVESAAEASATPNNAFRRFRGDNATPGSSSSSLSSSSASKRKHAVRVPVSGGGVKYANRPPGRVPRTPVARTITGGGGALAKATPSATPTNQKIDRALGATFGAVATEKGALAMVSPRQTPGRGDGGKNAARAGAKATGSAVRTTASTTREGAAVAGAPLVQPRWH
jgi:hypothetical protein